MPAAPKLIDELAELRDKQIMLRFTLPGAPELPATFVAIECGLLHVRLKAGRKGVLDRFFPLATIFNFEPSSVAEAAEPPAPAAPEVPQAPVDTGVTLTGGGETLPPADSIPPPVPVAQQAPPRPAPKAAPAAAPAVRPAVPAPVATPRPAQAPAPAQAPSMPARPPARAAIAPPAVGVTVGAGQPRPPGAPPILPRAAPRLPPAPAMPQAVLDHEVDGAGPDELSSDADGEIEQS